MLDDCLEQAQQELDPPSSAVALAKAEAELAIDSSAIALATVEDMAERIVQQAIADSTPADLPGVTLAKADLSADLPVILPVIASAKAGASAKEEALAKSDTNPKSVVINVTDELPTQDAHEKQPNPASTTATG